MLRTELFPTIINESTILAQKWLSVKAVSHVAQSDVHASLKAFYDVGICYQHTAEYIFVTFIIFVSLIILQGVSIV